MVPTRGGAHDHTTKQASRLSTGQVAYIQSSRALPMESMSPQLKPFPNITILSKTLKFYNGNQTVSTSVPPP
eukprot:COSAG02_NODE_43977_length_370_cov_0.605166_1_plen_71_part_10